MEVAIAAYNPDKGVDFKNMQLPEIFEEDNGKYTSKKTGKTYTINGKTAEIKEYNLEVLYIPMGAMSGEEVDSSKIGGALAVSGMTYVGSFCDWLTGSYVRESD